MAMAEVLASLSVNVSAEQQVQAKGLQTSIQFLTPFRDSSEPRTPDNEQPSSASRFNEGSPTSSLRQAALQAAPGKPAAKRGYDKWEDTEEDLFFTTLKSAVGCLPNVVCTAASKRIRTKDYIQTRAYYGRLVKRLDSALTPASQQSVHEDLGILHRAMLIYWNHWVNKAPGNNHSSDAFRSMLTKPRKTKDFHAAVQQGVNRLLQQANKVRPSPAALAAAEAAAQQQQKRPSPAKPAHQAQPAAQPASVASAAPAAAAPPGGAALHPAAAAASSGCQGQAAAAAIAVLAQGGSSAAPPAASSPAQPAGTSSGSPAACSPGAADSPGAAQPTLSQTAAAAAPPEPASQAQQPPRLLTVQMLPWGGAAKARVAAASANPFLELANLKSTKLVRFLADHLQKKWGAAQPPLLRVARLGETAAAVACASPDMQMGQLFLDAGLPDVFQLYYFWPAESSAEPAGRQQLPDAAQQQQQWRAVAKGAAATPVPEAPPAWQPAQKRSLATGKPQPAAKRTAAPAPSAHSFAAPRIVQGAVARVVPATQQAAPGNAPGAAASAAPMLGGHLAVQPPRMQQQPPWPEPPASSQAQPAASSAAGLMPPPATREDSHFGGAWPSLLVTPSLLAAPSLLGAPEPDSQQPPQQQRGAATPALAASSPPTSFNFAGLGLPGGSNAGSGSAGASNAGGSVSEHSNWGGASLAGLLSAPRLNEFGLEESCDAFAAGWGARGRGAGSASAQPAAPASPLRYFADLADSRLLSGMPPAGDGQHAHQRQPGGSLQDMLAAQRDRGSSGNADMVGILERLMSTDESSNLALPPSLLGGAALPRPPPCASRLAAVTAAAPAAGPAARPASETAAAAASGSEQAAAAAGCAVAAGNAAKPQTTSGRVAGGAAGLDSGGGGFAASLLGCAGLSQLEMDVGSLLGLGTAAGGDSWDAPACLGSSGGGSNGSGVSSTSSAGGGLKPFHQLFPGSEVKA